MTTERKPLAGLRCFQAARRWIVASVVLLGCLASGPLIAQEPQEQKTKHMCKGAESGGCPHMKKGQGDAGAQSPGGGMAEGRMGGGHRAAMGPIHELIDSHESITREVETLKDGVVTVTRSTDPDLVPTLQKHVGQMVEMLESGGSIRHWDPLFVEIFKHADQIDVRTELLDDGIRVWETASDPYVAKLIQAHAAKVSEFAERGREAMHEPTAVPEG